MSSSFTVGTFFFRLVRRFAMAAFGLISCAASRALDAAYMGAPESISRIICNLMKLAILRPHDIAAAGHSQTDPDAPPIRTTRPLCSHVTRSSAEAEA